MDQPDPPHNNTEIDLLREAVRVMGWLLLDEPEAVGDMAFGGSSVWEMVLYWYTWNNAADRVPAGLREVIEAIVPYREPAADSGAGSS